VLLTDIWFAAGEIEARALRGPSWAKVDAGASHPTHRVRTARLMIGHALIRLGRAISLENRSPELG
jgi:hypothetical protein